MSGLEEGEGLPDPDMIDLTSQDLDNANVATTAGAGANPETGTELETGGPPSTPTDASTPALLTHHKQFLTIEEMFKDPGICTKINTISQAQFATFPIPKGPYNKIINILNVVHQRKLEDTQHKIRKCVVLENYRELVQQSMPVGQIMSLLNKAYETVKTKANSGSVKGFRQTSLTSFFGKVRVEDEAGFSENTAAAAPSPSAQTKGVASNSKTKESLAETQLAKVFDMLGLDHSKAVIVESDKFVKIASDLLKSKTVMSLLKKFILNKKEYERNSAFQHKTSQFKTTINNILQHIEVVKEHFLKLVSICDRSELKGLDDLDLIADLVEQKRKEANPLAQLAFLKLNDTKFIEMLQSANQTFRRRAYDHKQAETEDKELKFRSFKAGESWSDCLSIVENEWKPSVSNGNLTFESFVRVQEMFAASIVRGDKFITKPELITWMQITKNSSQAIELFLRNLPILEVKMKQKCVYISIPSFLISGEMIEDLMSLKSPETATDKSLGPFSEESHPRKPGSGRVRIVTSQPEVLEEIRAYTESAGVAAENRRRDGVGRYGFSIPEVRSFLSDKLFADNPDKCPSDSTIRRVFTAPNLSARASSFYKGDINAKKASKRNDAAPGGGQRHPHQHECFSAVRLTRYNLVDLKL